MRRAVERRGSIPAVTLCLFLCLKVFALSVASEELIPRRSGERFQAAAPRLHFLAGRPLQRLHDGASVPFDFQLSIAAGAKNNVIERALERFVVSYDLWEERFSVVHARNRSQNGRHLSANAAEAWCLDNLSAPLGRLPADRNLWARLEIRGAEFKDREAPSADPGISLSALIEIFSRPARDREEHWTVEAGPFRLSDLRP